MMKKHSNSSLYLDIIYWICSIQILLVPLCRMYYCSIRVRTTAKNAGIISILVKNLK